MRWVWLRHILVCKMGTVIKIICEKCGHEGTIEDGATPKREVFVKLKVVIS